MVNKKCYSPVLKQKIPRIRFYWTVYFQTRKSKLITKTNLLKILTSKNTQNNRYSNINNIENSTNWFYIFIFDVCKRFWGYRKGLPSKFDEFRV